MLLALDESDVHAIALDDSKKGPMAMAPSVQFLRVSEQVRGRNSYARDIEMVTGG
jgi:hypothetical protein